jgi:hypothetical protein
MPIWLMRWRLAPSVELPAPAPTPLPSVESKKSKPTLTWRVTLSVERPSSRAVEPGRRGARPEIP